MKTFNVTLTRTAYENVVLEVKASSLGAAEDKINQVLDGPTRVSIDTLCELRGVRYLTTDLNGDDESSWEILDTEEAP